MAENLLGWLGIALAVGMAVTGCGKGGSKAGGHDFDSAAPEIKAAWEKAVAADQTNDYVTAVTEYRAVLVQRDHLSPSQIKAAEDANATLFQRMREGASKGDTAAQQALARLRDIERTRRPPH